MLRYPYINRVVTTAPATEPLTLAEAKAQCRVDIDDDDTLLTSLIVAARELVEKNTGRCLVTTVFKAYGDHFADEMVIPDPPLVSVGSVKYLDADDVEQTLATTFYQVSSAVEPARLWLKPGQSWPTISEYKQAVNITYTAGYGAASAVPQALKQAMRLLIGAWYEHREEIITGTIVSALPVPIAAKALMRTYQTGFMWPAVPICV